MKKCTLFSISMLLIACLGFVAADCSKCKKGDPGYPNCGDTVIPPPPSPTVERWIGLAGGPDDGTHPEELMYYPYSDSIILELWSNGKWDFNWPGIDHRSGIYQKRTSITSYPYPNDTIISLALHEIWNSGDTVLWESYRVWYADRHAASNPFVIPAPIIHTIDSLHLSPVVMRLYVSYPLNVQAAYGYYIKMQ
jgi:hypothetical protein